MLVIAKRAGIPVGTAYNWIRLARLDIEAALRRDAASIYVRRRSGIDPEPAARAWLVGIT